MAELDRGLYALLTRPAVFKAVDRVLTRPHARRLLADRYVRPNPGERLLDIGCGPASMLPYLGDVVYTGVDPEPAHIERARARNGARGTFITGRIQDVAGDLAGGFDVVIALGVLHHLDEADAERLVAAAHTALRPGGRLVISEPVLRPGQHPIARLLIRLDRGRNVRSEEGYASLVRRRFARIRAELRSDLVRFPYDHCIVSGEKSGADS